MNLRLSIDVENYYDKPLYTLKVYNLDLPVNYHSYDCVFFTKGYDFKELIETLKMSKYKSALDNLKEMII